LKNYVNSSLKIIIGIISIYSLASCDNTDERYDTGYSDGYAEGYNTTCKIRATLVEGDWESADYSRGYNDGRNEGARDCQSN
jgi:hypothetical protein